MVERKSKPRTKRDEEAEPEGVEALKQNPWFLLVLVIVIIAALIGGVILLSLFLSGQLAGDVALPSGGLLAALSV